MRCVDGLWLPEMGLDEGQVVSVDVFAGGDRRLGNPDRVSITANRLARGNIFKRQLVTGRNRRTDADRVIADLNELAFGKWNACDRNVVALVQANRCVFARGGTFNVVEHLLLYYNSFLVFAPTHLRIAGRAAWLCPPALRSG